MNKPIELNLRLLVEPENALCHTFTEQELKQLIRKGLEVLDRKELNWTYIWSDHIRRNED